ncbi:MAG: DNA-binding NarL/FixJ family response regulator [Algoriphagus sp.]|jgi:DNA-binding NarL/FixJ family response regulator
MKKLPLSNILILHSSNLICEILRESLEQRGYSVKSYATSGEEGLNKVRIHKFDLIIVSNSMPGISGLEVLRRLKDSGINTKIIFLSQNSNESNLVLRFLDVDGHIHTYDSMSELFFALQEVTGGRKYMSSSIEREINTLSKEELESAEFDTTVLESLTPREIQIMELLSESNTTPQIAQQFLISPATVNNHRANIMNKLNLKGRNQLIGVAISLKPFYKASAM